MPAKRRAATPAAKANVPNKGKKHLDEQLDEALEESFPASDPVAVTRPAAPARTKKRPELK